MQKYRDKSLRRNKGKIQGGKESVVQFE